MRSDLFAAANHEPAANWAVHRGKTLRVVVTGDAPLLAAKGAMVAYQGDARFDHASGGGGLTGMLKRAVSSDNAPLMRVSGDAEVFLAADAADVHIIELEQDSVCVNGRSLLAFEHTLTHDLQLNRGAGVTTGGLWSTLIHGTGRVAVTSKGAPLLLETGGRPTYTDTDATICWAGHMAPGMKSSANMTSMLRGGSGELFQYAFNGPGWVLVQPSEGTPRPASPSQSGGGFSFQLG